MTELLYFDFSCLIGVAAVSCCAVTNLDAGRPPVQSMRQLSLGASSQSWLAGLKMLAVAEGDAHM